MEVLRLEVVLNVPAVDVGVKKDLRAIDYILMCGIC
jgi:hypothetical protein